MLGGGLAVRFFIEVNSQEIELRAGCGPYLGRILSDPSGEDERFYSAETGGHCGDSGAQAVDEHIEGKLSPAIALPGGCENLAHVT